MRGSVRYILTGLVVLVAAGALGFKYLDYLTNPWTRDGQVRANVIQVSPRVSGPIIDLPIKDNQFVNAGDLLFRIDPRTFTAALDQAKANFDRTIDDLEALEQQVEASKASVAQFESQITQAQSIIKAMVAQVEDAQVTFERVAALLKNGNISRQRYDDEKANLDVAVANQERAEASLLEARGALLQAQATLAQAKANLGAPGEENARLRAANAAVEEAALNLEFTEVRASVDGYVTNLTLRLGSQAVENQPALALVDVNSYWIDAYFRESFVGRVTSGDRAVVTLMSYPDTPIEAKVDSIGWGIAQEDGSTSHDLLPQISPTFEWIRLAQRIPVRVQFETLPDGIDLRVGTTASVLVKTGTAGMDDATPVPPAPSLLQ